MIKEQLTYFLKTGTLKNISYGITRNQLAEILGKTEWMHFYHWKDHYPSILKYERIEFYFEHQHINAGLSGIMYQPIPNPEKSRLLKFNYHRLTKNTTLNQVKKFLNTNQINFHEKQNESDKECIILLTEGEVEMYFDSQIDSNSHRVNKIGRFVTF